MTDINKIDDDESFAREIDFNWDDLNDIKIQQNDPSVKDKKQGDRNEKAVEEGKIDYTAFTRFIQNVHPTKTVQVAGSPKQKKFGICDNLGHLSFRKKQAQIEKMAKEIGIGPTLFLMSTKALAYFFLLITIVNIPLMLFYSQGNTYSQQGFTSSSVFSRISMGNIGEISKTCSEINYARAMEDEFDGKSPQDSKTKIKMKCDRGKLTNLLTFGLSNEGGTCDQSLKNRKNMIDPRTPEKDILPDLHFLDKDCFYKADSHHYEHNSGFFDFRYQYNFTSKAYQYDEQITTYRGYHSMNFVQLLQFQNEHKDEDIKKNNFDAWWALNCKNKKACDVPINMFTYYYDSCGQENKQYKANSLWHYNQECRNLIKERVEKSTFSCNREQDQRVPEPLLIMTAGCDIDINNPFGIETITKQALGSVIVGFDMVVVIFFLIFIYFMEESQKNYVNQFQAESIEMNDFSIRVKGMPLDIEFEGDEYLLRAHLMNHFSRVIYDQMQKNKVEAGQVIDPDCFDDLNFDNENKKQTRPTDCDIVDIEFGRSDMFKEDYLKEFARIRLDFLKTEQDETVARVMLQKQWTEKLNKFNEEKSKKQKMWSFNRKKQSFRFAYIIFRSMDGLKLVFQAYKVPSWWRFLVMKFGGWFCRDKKDKLEKLYFFKRWPGLQVACDPDNIQWYNLKTKAAYRRIRTGLVSIVALIIVVASIICIIFVKDYNKTLQDQFNTNISCPQDISKQQAKADEYDIEKEQRQGYMQCYCQQESRKKNLLELRDIEFTVKGVQYKPCTDLANNITIQQGIVLGVSVLIVVINIISCTIFQYLAKVERKHTVNDETTGSFIKILIMQFINIAVVILIVNMQLLQDPLFGVIPILNGKYSDFNAQWYTNVGQTITLTMAINIGSPHISKLMLPLLHLFRRCWDRGCSTRLIDKKDGDKIKTKRKLQEEVNELYTGDQISSEYVYAQNFTYLWVVLMYSTGMPLLYPFACVFYTVLYWVYKFLLLKYYKKTNKFTEEMPMFSISFIKIGLILHCIFGFLLISSDNLIPPRKQSNPYFRNLNNKFHVELYLYFYLAVILWIILKNTILRMLSKLIQCCLFMKKKEEQEERDLAFSTDFLKEIKVQPLDNMYDKANEEFKQLKNCLFKFEVPNLTLQTLTEKVSKLQQNIQNEQDMKEFEAGQKEIETDIVKVLDEQFKNHNNYRFENEYKLNATNLIKLYKYRIQEIERVIDDHLIFLHGQHTMRFFNKEDYSQGVLKLTPVSPQIKLKYLLQKQPFLELKGGANREKNCEPRMRMQTTTQSYNMLDSAALQQLKTINKAFQDKKDWQLDVDVPQTERFLMSGQVQFVKLMKN